MYHLHCTSLYKDDAIGVGVGRGILKLQTFEM